MVNGGFGGLVLIGWVKMVGEVGAFLGGVVGEGCLCL